MPSTRKPHVATERFLQPVFDDQTGVVQTMRLIEPGERAELTDAEVAALGGKARAAEAAVESPLPGGPPDVGP